MKNMGLFQYMTLPMNWSNKESSETKANIENNHLEKVQICVTSFMNDPLPGYFSLCWAIISVAWKASNPPMMKRPLMWCSLNCLATSSNFPVGRVLLVPILAPPIRAQPLTDSQVRLTKLLVKRPSKPLVKPTGLCPACFEKYNYDFKY